MSIPVVVIPELDTERATKIQQLLASTGWVTVPLDKAVPSDQKQLVFLDKDQEVSPTFTLLKKGKDWKDDWSVDQIAEAIKAAKEGPKSDVPVCAVCGKPITEGVVVGEQGAVHAECVKPPEGTPPSEPPAPASPTSPPAPPVSEQPNTPGSDIEPKRMPKRFSDKILW